MAGARGVFPRTARPYVSVVMPCRNERRFIGGALRSLLDGSYARNAMEVIVVDGGSSDGTREVLRQFERRDERVRLIDNPRGVTPTALNIGICAARGDIVVRADAHSVYPERFIETLVRTLDETGADMVGACSINRAASPSWVNRAIVLAIDSPFGTGSRFRYRRRSGPVDAVQLGCWRRELFERVGLFDERLLRNQDNEHSSRILRAGGRVHMTADVCIEYFPRQKLPEIWRHGAANGMWNAFTERIHPYTFRYRHALPALYFLGVLLAATLVLIGLADPALRSLAWLGAALVTPYTVANLLFASSAAIGDRRPHLAPLVAFVFASYHFAYGYGIVKGWWLVLSGGWRSRIGGGLSEARLS